MSTTDPSAKPRKRPAAKAASGKGGDKVKCRSGDKLKCSLVLTADIDFRLTVNAAAERIDRSALVNRILGEALRRYRIQDLGPAATGESQDRGDVTAA